MLSQNIDRLVVGSSREPTGGSRIGARWWCAGHRCLPRTGPDCRTHAKIAHFLLEYYGTACVYWGREFFWNMPTKCFFRQKRKIFSKIFTHFSKFSKFFFHFFDRIRRSIRGERSTPCSRISFAFRRRKSRTMSCLRSSVSVWAQHMLTGIPVPPKDTQVLVLFFKIVVDGHAFIRWFF